MGNTPDFRDPDSNVGMGMGMPPVYHHHLPPPPPRTYSMAPQQQVAQSAPADHWGAAESLTFLKRGSPASDRKPAPHSGHRPFTLGVSPVTKASPMGKGGGGSGVDMASMPSLASSSDGTSPGDRNKLASCSTPEDATKRQDDALLLAAVAMTEFGQSPPPTSSPHKRSLPSSERTAMTSNRFGGGNESEDEDDDDIGTEPPSRRSIVFEESPSPPSSQRRSGRKRSKRFTGDDS